MSRRRNRNRRLVTKNEETNKEGFDILGPWKHALKRT